MLEKTILPGEKGNTPTGHKKRVGASIDVFTGIWWHLLLGQPRQPRGCTLWPVLVAGFSASRGDGPQPPWPARLLVNKKGALAGFDLSMLLLFNVAISPTPV
ncbi:MAG: hypothetical protein ACOX1X_06325 [Dethiobacteria bacterium]